MREEIYQFPTCSMPAIVINQAKTRSERVLELDTKFDQKKATAKTLADQNPDLFTLTTLLAKEGFH